MRGQALKLLPLLLSLVIGLSALLTPAPARAAEVLQVRTATLLQVGDRNRSYPVQLACVQIVPASGEQALQLARQRLPRHSRVNLRPLGRSDGQLLAQVRILPSGEDLGSALVDAGLAERLDGAARPEGCPTAGAPPQA